MPLNKFISLINETIEGLLPNMVVYGIAETVQRKVGNEVDYIPAIVNGSGEYKYVGVDDIKSAIIYHKLGAVTITRARSGAVGDNAQDYINSYTVGMIVYMDMKRTKLTPDELLLYIQANIPDQLRLSPYQSVNITLRNVILNGNTVWNQEYNGTPFKLPAERTLFQINYTIESQMKKICFEKCPEVCT